MVEPALNAPETASAKPGSTATLEAASPMRLALLRLARTGGARFGIAVLALLLLLGTYAPFISSEVAYVWHDEHGWRYPLFTDLFNRWSYTKRHDLLFNVLALEAPFLVVACLVLGRRMKIGRLIAWSSAIVILSWIACMLPLRKQGDDWRSFWDKRAQAHATIQDYQALPPDTHAWAVFPPIPHRFDATYVGAVLAAPLDRNQETGHRFWLGTDTGGKDVLSQMLFGARISLTIGFVASGLSLLIGTLIGGVSGYFGGWVDMILQRIVEIMMCFPTFLLILTVVAMLDRDIFKIMMVIGLTGWAGTARLVRGEFLAQSVRDYVAAGESMGLSRWRIMFRHILPNALTPLIITATFGIAGAVLSESGLSFLGLGDPTAPSWGGLLEQGRENIRYGWLIYAPGLAVFLLVTALNLLGNGLREALDPKSTT